MSNKNFTHNSNYYFGTTLFTDNVLYNIQQVNLPGVAFSHIKTSKSSVEGFLTGDTLVFNALNVNIIVDEKLETWQSIMSTIFVMREQDKGLGSDLEGQAWIVLQDDNGHNILKVTYHSARIESIGDLEFNSISEDEIITLDIGLVYDNFTIESYI